MQKVNWQDLLLNACYFQWKELSNNTLSSVRYVEDQQEKKRKILTLRKPGPDEGKMDRRAWKNTFIVQIKS